MKAHSQSKKYQAGFLAPNELARVLGWVMLALLAGSSLPGSAQDVQHLPIPLPGGMPGLPVMTGVEKVTNGVQLSWFGPSGYYQLYQKLGLTDPSWRTVGGLTLSNRAFVATAHPNPLYRVTGPAPQYAGSLICRECHPATHQTFLNTAHPKAFSNPEFTASGGSTNASCLVCHTVGAGLPTGFVNATRTPRLAGVQCESCHGPAAKHAASPDDFTTRPRREVAGTLCGGCHNATHGAAGSGIPHPPTFEEWQASGHAEVTASLKSTLARTKPQDPVLSSCGECHSGTIRAALVAKSPLPYGSHAGAVGVSCATCHDQHAVHVHSNAFPAVVAFTNPLTGLSLTLTNRELGAVYTNQLRYPLNSLEDYHSTGEFPAHHNPRVQLCAQCHNDRGASFLSGEAAPHPSLQYNFLLGTVGELPNGSSPGLPSTHSRIEKQCVTCHMPTSDHSSGHRFAVTSYETCASCHGTAANAAGFVGFVRGIITNLTQQVKIDLDRWALTQAPPQLRKYGALAWEYQQPGHLSNSDATAHGPIADRLDESRDEQHLIPAGLRKARFNLYLVLNDGSYGVHNGPYAISLLLAAQEWIQQELEE